MDKYILTRNKFQMISQLAALSPIGGNSHNFTQLNKLDTQKCFIKTFRSGTAPNIKQMKPQRKYRIGTSLYIIVATPENAAVRRNLNLPSISAFANTWLVDLVNFTIAGD